MREITLKIPEKKLHFFLELVEQLGLEIAIDNKVSPETHIPSEHKAIIRERIKKSNQNPERLLDWEVEKVKLRFE